MSELTSSADRLRSLRFVSSSFFFSSLAFRSFASLTVFLVNSRASASIIAHTSADTPSGGSSLASGLDESEKYKSHFISILNMSLNFSPTTLNYNIPDSVSESSHVDLGSSESVFSGFLFARFLTRSLLRYFFLLLNFGSANNGRHA